MQSGLKVGSCPHRREHLEVCVGSRISSTKTESNVADERKPSEEVHRGA